MQLLTLFRFFERLFLELQKNDHFKQLLSKANSGI